MTFDQHPIARWVGIGTLVAGVGGGAFFVVDERERSISQTVMLEAIREEQGRIVEELIEQTADLEEIRRVQTTITDTVKHGIDRVERRQGELSSMLHATGIGLAGEVGRLKGLHEKGRHEH